MDLLVFVVIAFAGSIGAGTFGALLGLGGGIVVIPLLTLALGVDIHYAIGASLISVLATSSGAAVTFVRQGLANRRLGLFLAVAATVGAVMGASAAAYIAPQGLYVIFAVVLGLSAFVMSRRRYGELPVETPNHPWSERLGLAGACPDVAGGQAVPYNVAGVPRAFGAMYFAGLLAGLLGIGGGAIQVPAMDVLMRLPIKAASATSNFMLGITAVASAGIYFARGDIVPVVAGPVAIGVLLGALLGARLLTHVRGAALRRLYVVVIVVVALQMAARGVGLHIA